MLRSLLVVVALTLTACGTASAAKAPTDLGSFAQPIVADTSPGPDADEGAPGPGPHRFTSDLTLTLSKHTLEVLRMARSPLYPDIKDWVATGWITEEIIAQGLWPGIAPPSLEQ